MVIDEEVNGICTSVPQRISRFKESFFKKLH